jgi:hypothetical protein
MQRVLSNRGAQFFVLFPPVQVFARLVLADPAGHLPTGPGAWPLWAALYLSAPLLTALLCTRPMRLLAGPVLEPRCSTALACSVYTGTHRTSGEFDTHSPHHAAGLHDSSCVRNCCSWPLRKLPYLVPREPWRCPHHHSWVGRLKWVLNLWGVELKKDKKKTKTNKAPPTLLGHRNPECALRRLIIRRSDCTNMS